MVDKMHRLYKERQSCRDWRAHCWTCFKYEYVLFLLSQGRSRRSGWSGHGL